MSIPSGDKVLGETGHLQDHNDITDVLRDHEERITEVEGASLGIADVSGLQAALDAKAPTNEPDLDGPVTIAGEHGSMSLTGDDFSMSVSSDTDIVASGMTMNKEREGGAAVEVGDFIGYVAYAQGSDGSDLVQGLQLHVEVDDTVDAGIVPMALVLSQQKADGTFEKTHRWNSDGSTTPASGGATTLDDLSDVDTSGGVTGDFLRLESGAWVPKKQDPPWPLDIPPTSPSAKDDEFTTLSGWTTLGTVDTMNVTDVPGVLHMKRTTTGREINGIYKTVPSIPFTVTTKFASADEGPSTNNPGYGLMLLDSTPTAIFAGLVEYGTGYGYWNDLYRASWTNRTTIGSAADFNMVMNFVPKNFPYMRLVVASATSVTVQYSADGLIWRTAHSAINPGFTPAYVGIGIAVVGGGAGSIEALVEWIRFT